MLFRSRKSPAQEECVGSKCTTITALGLYVVSGSSSSSTTTTISIRSPAAPRRGVRYQHPCTGTRTDTHAKSRITWNGGGRSRKKKKKTIIRRAAFGDDDSYNYNYKYSSTTVL